MSGLGVQHNALLNRHMRFRAIALRTSVARLVASVAAIGAALAGAGYWSLVVLQVTQTVVALLVVWTAVRWRPGPPRGLSEAVPLLRFGAGVSAAGLLNTVSRNADNVLIGRVLGADALGLYTRAYGLLLVPLRQLKSPLGSIVEPVLSSMQDQPARYRQFYCAAIQGLSHVGMPSVAVLAVVSNELVLVLLGEQWLAAVPVFQFLAIAGLVQLVSSTTGWLFVSSGRSGPFAQVGGDQHRDHRPVLRRRPALGDPRGRSRLRARSDGDAPAQLPLRVTRDVGHDVGHRGRHAASGVLALIAAAAAWARASAHGDAPPARAAPRTVDGRRPRLGPRPLLWPASPRGGRQQPGRPQAQAGSDGRRTSRHGRGQQPSQRSGGRPERLAGPADSRC